MTVAVPVELGARRYEVRLGELGPEAVAETLAEAFGGETTGVALLVDGGVAALPRARALSAALAARLPGVAQFELRAGEACKSLAEVERTLEWLARRGYDRRAAIVGLGGGAATDHAGFAAAVYLRGVRFATVPTTLLAMVDASVGGKTGVDLQAGKNLVGAFHQPRAVVADLGFLDTLPPREKSAGLAEVIKCGFIADPVILELAERHGADLPAAVLRELIARAIRVKAEVVAEDETESGRRAILNFGHTVGHALEAASGYELLHGEAVALGMVAALDLGAALDVGPRALADRARSLLARLALPTDYAARLNPGVWERLAVDKKRRGGAIRFVFVTAPGQTVLRDIAPGDISARLGTLAAPEA
ncbi:MAG TPA: 3-dehydroquinate synthase [Polyangia bacterium]|nr:3-dehydroquinate synthase [Polyangia bacterium]